MEGRKLVKPLVTRVYVTSLNYQCKKKQTDILRTKKARKSHDCKKKKTISEDKTCADRSAVQKYHIIVVSTLLPNVVYVEHI